MKKHLFVIICLCAGLLSACTAEDSAPPVRENDTAPVEVNIAVLRGPTAIGMVKLMDESDNEMTQAGNYSDRKSVV